MFTPHLFPTLRSTTHLVSKNSPKSFPGQRIASIQRKAMPFIPGPRRAEMDENGERTYFCSWDGESCQPRLSTPRTTGVDERGKSHSTVGAPQQSDQEPSIFLRSGVIHTPFFPQSLILRRLSVIIDYFSAHRISRPVCAGVSRKHEKDKHSGLTVPLGRLYEKVWNRWARSKA